MHVSVLVWSFVNVCVCRCLAWAKWVGACPWKHTATQVSKSFVTEGICNLATSPPPHVHRWFGSALVQRREEFVIITAVYLKRKTHITAKELMTVFPYWGKKKKYWNEENSKIHFFPHPGERCHSSFLCFLWLWKAKHLLWHHWLGCGSNCTNFEAFKQQAWSAFDMGIYVNSRGSLINMKLWHEVQEGALNELKFNYLITRLSRTLPQPWLLSTEGTWFSEGADAVPATANLYLSKFKTVLSRWQPYTYSSVVLPFFLSSEALVNSRACIRLPPFWYHETQINQHV